MTTGADTGRQELLLRARAGYLGRPILTRGVLVSRGRAEWGIPMRLFSSRGLQVSTRSLMIEQLEARCLLSPTLQAISQPPAGQPPSASAAGASTEPSVSADGRYVAFESSASNLVPGQSGGSGNNIFVLDRVTGTTTLVSHVPGEPTTTPANLYFLDSSSPSISRNGRYVVYISGAAQLIGHDPNGVADQVGVVVYDRTTGLNTLVSHSTASPTISSGDANAATISSDGRYIVFGSYDTDVVPNQVTTNSGYYQLYVYDQNNQTTSLVSHAFGKDNVTSDGQVDSYSLSFVAGVADDGTIGYACDSSNLVNPPTTKGVPKVYTYSPATQTNQLVGAATDQPVFISRDGSTIIYENSFQLFRYNTVTQVTTTVDSDGTLPLAMNSNGQFIAYLHLGTGDVGDVYLYDASGSTVIVSHISGSPAVGAGGVPAGLGGVPDSHARLGISDDGSLVAYCSSAGNIVPGQSGPAGILNVFLYSSVTGQNTLVSGVNGSVSATGSGDSSFPALSGAGSVLAFQSLAPNLIGGLFDGNGTADVFTDTPGSAGVTLVSRAAFNVSLPGASFTMSVSADGRYTVFTSSAGNLVPDQVNANDNQNVFLFDKQTGIVTLVNHVPGLPNTSGDGGILGNNGTDRILQDTFPYPPLPIDSRPPYYMDPVISADGTYIAFASFDDNLVPNFAPTQDNPAVYLYNVQTGVITAAINAPAGSGDAATSPAISADGRYLTFLIGSLGIPPHFAQATGALVLYDQTQGTQIFITNFNNPPNSVPPTGTTLHAAISDDGRFVAYEDQGNVYVFDRKNSASTLVSYASGSPLNPANGASSLPVISHDGRMITFVSSATNLVNNQVASSFTNVFEYKIATGVVTLVSGVNGSATIGGNGNSDSPAIDGDGSFIVYRSYAANLVTGQSGLAGNIFEFNTQTGTQTLVSAVSGATTTAAGGSSNPVIDDDGHLISYVSTAPDLVPGQSGVAGVENVFVWLRQTGVNILASGQDGSPSITGNAPSDSPMLARHRFPAFSSRATNLVQGLGGTSIAYINTLIQLVLSPNTIADGSTSGTVVGNLAITTLLVGQYIPAVYSLPQGQGDNASFFLVAASSGELLIFDSQPAANYATKPTYQVVVDVNAGFGDDLGTLSVYVASPSDPPSGAPVDAYLNHLYSDILNRAPDPGGLANFGSDLEAGSATYAQVAGAFVGSPEYHGQEVGNAYQTILGRPVDSAGSTFWSSYLNAGHSLFQFETQLYGSQEFFNDSGGTNTKYVAALYEDILRRATDSSSAGWVQELNGGAVLATVSSAILTSMEAVDGAVNRLYVTYLRRFADAGGLQSFATGILADSTTYEQVIVALAASGEYQRLAQGDANARYVGSLYQTILGRPADASGLANFTSALDSGSATQGQVVSTLLTSAEYRTDAIDRIYMTYLKRSPDSVGLQAGLLTLSQGGADEQIAENLVASTEFFNDNGGNNTGFVKALYQEILQRPGITSEVNGWVRSLQNGASRLAVSGMFLASHEYHVLVLQGLYEHYLGRAADPSGLAGLTAALDAGMSDESAIVDLAASLEFFDRA